MAMASSRKFNNDSEDSGYVKVEGLQMQGSKSKNGDVKITEKADLEQIKLLNKNLSTQIKALKKTLINKDEELKAEKLQLNRSHRRDIDKFKRENGKIQSQFAAKNSEMQMEVALYKDEIQKLKAQIQLLGETEIKLRDRLKTLDDTKNKQEYEQQRREISASKTELKKLKEQIASLEKVVEERNAQIAKANEEKSVMAAGFDRTIGEMTQKHEELKSGMASMKSDLLEKMEENDKSTKEMFRNLNGLLLAGKERQTSVEPSPSMQRSAALPPISVPGSKSRTDSQSTHWIP